MRYPTFEAPGEYRSIVDNFRGYNHNTRIGDGEFFDMENMTSDLYPVLSPRPGRSLLEQGSIRAMISKDSLCYVDGQDFVVNGYHIDLGLTDGPKQLVSMGAYVIILPDKMWINTLDTTDFGKIEAKMETASDVTFELSTVDGEQYSGAVASSSEPDSPENMQYWIDTSSQPHVLRQYSSASAMWVDIPTTYIRISAVGIGKAFEKFDGVTISGAAIESLNAATVIWGKGDDYIIVPGILDAQVVQSEPLTVERAMPDMDFVTESGNRLWGCKYGLSEGKIVNEIYASKLGDFKNWNCFMGISTDSYAASCGTDGPFTGAITHLGYPLFFKEGCVHKVYGNYPANFQVQATALRGVQKGCSRSLAIVGEVLYYKAQHAVCAYDGSLPQEVSGAFGEVSYHDAVAAAHGNKYYVSLLDEKNEAHLFVLDTAKGMWHREDNFRVEDLCSCKGILYGTKEGCLYDMTNGSGNVSWSLTTGPLGTDDPEQKYISRLTVRLSMAIGARVAFFIQYDSMGPWTHAGSVTGTALRSFSVPVRPRRCDHFRLRIEGVGDVRIFSVAKTIAEGSELA
jgi:hypothetical protein